MIIMTSYLHLVTVGQRRQKVLRSRDTVYYLHFIWMASISRPFLMEPMVRGLSALNTRFLKVPFCPKLFLWFEIPSASCSSRLCFRKVNDPYIPEALSENRW